MEWNPKNVQQERLSSIDETGKRVFIQPSSVVGYFRTRRNYFYWFLIVVFLVVPWTSFQEQQTILLNIAERRFVFFGQTFWAHDSPLLLFPVLIALLVLGLVTAIWGRVWCGWACPQTVFLDSLYRKIESWVEGNQLQRIKLSKEPWSIKKLKLKSIKWFLFFIASAHIAHSFAAYFVGAKNLVWITLGSPSDHWTLFLFVQSLTLVLLFNFGWFREQFCIIMCPYGKFQSVFMDANSLAIMYDEKRGEPRRGSALTKAVDPVKTKSSGDCVSCFRCVSVCPTGIDIRNGVQLECIGCTACIDACDEVMTKVNKPTGLIRYSSVNQMEGNKHKRWTIRVYVFTALILILSGFFGIHLATREPFRAEVIRAIGEPYTVTKTEAGTTIINHFRIHLSNQSQSPLQITHLKTNAKDFRIVAPTLPFILDSGQERWHHFFVHYQPSHNSNTEKVQMEVQLVIEGEEPKSIPLTILGPITAARL